jgi:hypothetical protein
MERRFDMSDFEQSLKDHADQFKMTPSKRVWNGIYNNLHPGSKWPSITVAVVFLITLFTIGSLNDSTTRFKRFSNNITNSSTDADKSAANNKSGNGISTQKNKNEGDEAFANENKSRSKTSNLHALKNEGQSKDITDLQVQNSSLKSVPATISTTSGVPAQNHAAQKDESSPASNSISIERNENEAQLKGMSPTAIKAPVNEQKSEISFLQLPVKDLQDLRYDFLNPAREPAFDLFIPASYKIFSVPPVASLAGKLIGVDRIEPVIPTQNNMLAENSTAAGKLHKKKNNKIEWTFYVNPTISTVSFNKKTVQPSDNSSSLVVLSNQPSFKLIHNARFGIETGAEMTLQIAKKLQFVTGINLSYSGYNNVSNLVHPTFATLDLNDDKGGTYSKTYITHYGNGQSQDHINLVNYSIEASIPLGIQYNIWKSQKTRIDVSSLLEPSIVLRDDAYLISSDGRYYVNDPLLVRRTNLEGHFGSYITFIGRKIRWHIGPDFRYQLLSTYKNIYPTREHLIDYGIRIGISK